MHHHYQKQNFSNRHFKSGNSKGFVELQASCQFFHDTANFPSKCIIISMTYNLTVTLLLVPTTYMSEAPVHKFLKCIAIGSS